MLDVDWKDKQCHLNSYSTRLCQGCNLLLLSGENITRPPYAVICLTPKNNIKNTNKIKYI